MDTDVYKWIEAGPPRDAEDTEISAPEPRQPRRLERVDDSPGRWWKVEVRQAIPVGYLKVAGVASGLIVLATMIGIVSPWVGAIATGTLASTLVERGRWYTAGGVALLALTIAAGLLGGSPTSAASAATAPVPAAAEEPPPPAGSLNLRLSDLTGAWNEVDAPPTILRGLTRSTETGQFDSFIYRFDDWGRLAGAYDPDDEAVYGLLATGQFSGPGTAHLYLHLCFVLQPYSQECITSYFERGLDGGTLADYVDIEHHASWKLDGHTWAVDIEENVLTIRVLADTRTSDG